MKVINSVIKTKSACDMENGELGIIISDNVLNGHFVLAVTRMLLIDLTAVGTIWERRIAETFKVMIPPNGTQIVLEQNEIS